MMREIVTSCCVRTDSEGIYKKKWGSPLAEARTHPRNWHTTFSPARVPTWPGGITKIAASPATKMMKNFVFKTAVLEQWSISFWHHGKYAAEIKKLRAFLRLLMGVLRRVGHSRGNAVNFYSEVHGLNFDRDTGSSQGFITFVFKSRQANAGIVVVRLPQLIYSSIVVTFSAM
jgi:hypothetical protein